MSPKQKLNSEQLLFWTSSHISTLNAIFGKFWLFLQKWPNFYYRKKIWPRKKVDFEVEILKIFQKIFFHENKRLIANNFYFGLFVISLTVFSLNYIFQINLKNVIPKRKKLKLRNCLQLIILEILTFFSTRVKFRSLTNQRIKYSRIWPLRALKFSTVW